MEKYIEYVYCNQTHSSSSSTKIFCDDEKLCSPCGCYRCCKSAFFNDHTYSILKRICHKIIKNHNRKRCREYYSVFDGGNSLNSRPVLKGQKDGPDIFNNWMQTESEFRRNGCRENEDFRVLGLIRNGNGKWKNACNENIDKIQNSRRPYVSGEQNKNNNGEVQNVKKRVLDERGKKYEETVYKTNINLFENAHNKYNEKKTKQLRKRKGEMDYDKDGSKKSAGVKSLDRNNDIDEKFGKNKNQGTTEEKDRKNKKSKTEQLKIEKNLDQGELNKNEKKKDNERKNRTSKAKQTKIERNVDQVEINKYEEIKEKDRRNITNKDKQPKIEKYLDHNEINRNEDSTKKSDQGKGKRKNELNHTIRENDTERDNHKDEQDNKLVKIVKQEIGSKDKHKYDESYKAMPKKKNSDVFVKKDRVDDKKTKKDNDKPETIAFGLVNENSAKSKFKTGSGRGSRLFVNESTFLKKANNEGKSSKILANRKHHGSKGIMGMPRELQSCRYVRPCDVLRVKLEERDLSRCIACCLPCRPYISCSSYQCGLPCG